MQKFMQKFICIIGNLSRRRHYIFFINVMVRRYGLISTSSRAIHIGYVTISVQLST